MSLVGGNEDIFKKKNESCHTFQWALTSPASRVVLQNATNAGHITRFLRPEADL